jgi:hypothetical protein
VAASLRRLPQPARELCVGADFIENHGNMPTMTPSVGLMFSKANLNAARTVTGGTLKKSTGTVWERWLRRNVF